MDASQQGLAPSNLASSDSKSGFDHRIHRRFTVNRRIASRLSVILVAAVFAAVTYLVPASAEAQWESHYDEFPGEDSPDWGKIIAIGVIGGVATVAIVYLVKGKTADESDTGVEEDPAEGATGGETTSSEPEAREDSAIGFASSMLKGQESPFGIHFDIDHRQAGIGISEPRTDFTDVTIEAGITFSF